MENDIQAYQRQLEAKKKMQDDLDKELQFAFREISKLTALVDGKGTVQIYMSAHWPPRNLPKVIEYIPRITCLLSSYFLKRIYNSI